VSFGPILFEMKLTILFEMKLTKTGSGQTQGKLKQTCCLLAAL
jgi:hypothetical protein